LNSKNVVAMSLVGSGIIVTVDDIRTDGIKGTHLLALGIVYIAVSAATDISPQVGVPFALLVFTTIALTKGAKVFNAIGDASSSKKKLPKYGEKPSTFVPKKGGS
jgi:hypothetical protein